MLLLALILLEAVSFQVIQVNVTEPCFLNFTAGPEIFRNCGLGDDYLEAALLGWEWITGGFFSMIIVSLFIMASYIKYHKAVYPLIIGIAYIPIAIAFFPDEFLNFGFIFAGAVIFFLALYIIMKQTKEY